LTYVSDKADQRPLATEPALTEEMRVFPNPAADQLSIVLPAQVQPATIVLMDARGGKVLEGPAQLAGTTSLNISHLPKGLYLLRIIYQQTSATRRVIID
jgi:hypothetical protein